jgi:hypothetical protein
MTPMQASENLSTKINNLRNFIYIIAIGIFTTFCSCVDSVEPLTLVTVERNFEIPGNLNTIETHFFELKNIPVLLDQNLAIYNRTVEDVVNINPDVAVLTSAFNNIDWTFIQRVEIFAVSRLNNTNKVRMFQSNEPDFGDRSQLGLFNTFVDVKEIFKEGLIDLEIRIKTRAFVPTNINAKLTFTYAIFDEI